MNFAKLKLLGFFLLSFVFLSNLHSQNEKILPIGFANTAFELGNYKKARKLYTKIIDSNDTVNIYEAYYMRAYSNYKLGSYKDAINDSQKIFLIPKNNEKYYYLMGNGNWLLSRIYNIQLEEEKSLLCLKEATKYIQNSLLYSTLSISEYELGYYDDSLNNATLAIKLDGTNAFAYNNRALVLLKLNKFDKAIIDVNKSIELDNLNPYAFKHRALIFLEIGELEKACIDLNHSKKIGYSSFQNETDSDHVDNLLIEHCNEKK